VTLLGASCAGAVLQNVAHCCISRRRFSNGTQNNFLKNWGSAALTLSQFETSLSALTNVGVMQIDAQYQFFVKLYGAAPANLPAGYANADAAARATTFGFAVGTDMDNPTLNPALIAEVENAKVLNALTINGDVAGASGYQTFKALALQPIAPPLQGAAGPHTRPDTTSAASSRVCGAKWA
jgi:hypothetical protein